MGAFQKMLADLKKTRSYLKGLAEIRARAAAEEGQALGEIAADVNDLLRRPRARMLNQSCPGILPKLGGSFGQRRRLVGAICQIYCK